MPIWSGMAKKKKKRSPVVSILAFVTILIVTIFIFLREKRTKTTEITQYTNSSFSTYQNMHINDNRRTLLSHSVRKKRLADALWTVKPNIPKLLEFPEDKKYVFDDIGGRSLVKDIDTEISDDESENESTNENAASSLEYETTPSVTDAPTTPITTQSITTPIYTETPTSPITTESVTTPQVTEPTELEVTTESDSDDIDSETLRLIRNRRGLVGGGTTTTQFPLICGDGNMDDDDYYTGPEGDCECGLGMTGPSCTDVVDEAQRDELLAKSLFFTTEAIGYYENTTRKDFQAELEKHYGNLTGFVRVFVMPTTFNPVTNRTELSYYVLFDKEADADDATRSASITAEIVGDVLPIEVNNQTVTFGEDSTLLLRPKENGSIQSIPIPSIILPTVCYIYDKIGACNTTGKGECVDRNGEPYCKCTEGYVGEFCEDEIQYAPASDDDEILTILMPTLAAAAVAVTMCSCCFFCCRRVNKGDEVASIYSDESWVEPPRIILPRYYPYSWKQFIAGAEMEHEEGGIYKTISMEEVAPVVVERPVIQPVIVERVVVEDRYRDVLEPQPVVERPVIQPVVVERVVVQDRPVVPVGMETEVVDNDMSSMSNGSVILPRFYPTPFRQLIAGPSHNGGEVISGRYVLGNTVETSRLVEDEDTFESRKA